MFGEILRKLREEKGLSQKDLANYLKISRQAYNHYEAEKREPSYETLKALSNYFEVSTDYLLGKSKIKNPEKQESEFVIPEKFTDPDEARKYVEMHTIFGSNGFDADKMSDEEILQFANEMLKQIDLISYKFKK